ncbi:MAG: transaldolase [Thermostichales cyanobacterium SZTDM-1c_bins_54]
MTTRLHQLWEHGQSVWMDNLSRTIISNGELARWIDQGVRGITSNPAIFKNAIAGNTDYDAGIQTALQSGASINDIYESLVLQDISDAAALFLPVYEASQGLDGYISIEVSPKLAHSTASTILEAQRFFQILAQPNIMIKIPGTAEGLPAVTEAIAAGINVNVTLLFSIQNYIETAWAYIAGLEKLDAAGGDISRVASVASFFLSRIDTSIDKLLDAKMAQGIDCASLKGTIAIANAKLAYQEYLKIFSSERFQKLAAKGARPQRLLWASTSTKNPAYRDTLYVEELIGANTVNTIPPETLVAFLDHGQVADTLTQDLEAAQQAMQALTTLGIDLEQVLADLQADGVEKFVQAFDQLLAALEAKVQQMSTVGV